jgi:hypothetical protein
MDIVIIEGGFFKRPKAVGKGTIDKVDWDGKP